jgi:hypothetical protein
MNTKYEAPHLSPMASTIITGPRRTTVDNLVYKSGAISYLQVLD